jgi:hypothetical protein
MHKEVIILKKLIVVLFTVICSFSAHSFDLDVHGESSIIRSSYDLGFDIVTENSEFYFTTGLYREQFKEYKKMFESEGVYLGVGRYFSMTKTFGFSANAKLYENGGFSDPVYCLSFMKRLDLF